MELDLQLATEAPDIPKQDAFATWIRAALATEHLGSVLTVRIVDKAEMSHLNESFRHKPGPTNVLAFPSELPEEVDIPFLGDIIICAPIVVKEASEQHKSVQAHWAHLTIHGTLHLLGYDHQTDAQAMIMETLEKQYLHQLGFADPYAPMEK